MNTDVVAQTICTRCPTPPPRSSEDDVGSAQGEQLLVPGDHRDLDEGPSSANQLDMISIDDELDGPLVPEPGTHLIPPSPILPTLPPFSPFDSTATPNDTLLYHYNNNNNNNNNKKKKKKKKSTMDHDHVAVFNNGDEALHRVIDSQSSLPVHHVAHTPHATTLARDASVHGPVSDSAVPGITADMDAMSLSSPVLGSVAPEDTFITVPGDKVALAVAIIVDLAVRYATRIGDRWLCPFSGCLQEHVGSKDSLKHHLHRIHYRPSELLHCPVEGCNQYFGYYLDLNRHINQVHLGVGHFCPCAGRWYARLETLRRRCQHGPNCPGAIDRRMTRAA
ncbi:hypothetical protein BG006_000802 [Podila minutissima]|uniref:C2H2-type domain-containing protein n=1 Tax=Podila minutissima TaxID=64525 RepID=A0A9P5VPK8_9FUNG|nr:hypothetical protein BG006_000802 [Podila minutissima]